jgi:sugar/nucleoside kinase (ribokinase family)
MADRAVVPGSAGRGQALKIAGGIICSGNVVFDIIVRPVDEIRWHTTAWVEAIDSGIGGNGGTTSYTLAKLGVPVRLLSHVGADRFGDQLLSALFEAGVDISQVTRSATLPTSTSVSLVNAAGDRSLQNLPGATREAFPQPIAFRPEAGHYHLANPFSMLAMRPHLAKTLENAQEAGLSTSLDTGWDALGQWMELLEPCLGHLDLLFLNEAEACRLSEMADARSAASHFRCLRVSAVVVKLGSKGCLVDSPEGIFEVPAFPVEIADTTGAGDAFVGGFLAGLYKERSWFESAKFANAVGALSVRKSGGTAGIISYEETISWMNGLW